MTRGSTIKKGKSLKGAASAPAEFPVNLKAESDKMVGSKHLVYHRENFPCN